MLKGLPIVKQIKLANNKTQMLPKPARGKLQSMFDKDRYQCYSSYGSSGYQFILNISRNGIEYTCNKSSFSIIIAVTTAIVSLASVFCFALLPWGYRLHWLLKYYKTTPRLSNIVQGTLVYDTFIPYSVWVHNVLGKHLRTSMGLNFASIWGKLLKKSFCPN